jgi:hypothetical protein
LTIQKKEKDKMSSYYLHRDGQNHGPYPIEDMKQLIASGQVGPNELICPEGGSDWAAASTLTAGGTPKLVTGGLGTTSRPSSSRISAITQQQVAAAYQKVKTPILGVVFSTALPFLLWAAKSDAERGVRTTGKNRALKELAKDNTDLLPIAIVIGVIGVVLCSIWFMKSLKRAKGLKAQFQLQQLG